MIRRRAKELADKEGEAKRGQGRRIGECARKILSGRYIPVWAAVVGMVLTLPALNGGLLLDDYHQKLAMSGSKSIVRLIDSPLDMFRFFDGDPNRLRELRDFGFVPWWTYERVKAAFWRPLASATHWLDYVVWPDSPWLMHVHSILWYGALMVAVAFLYRRFVGPVWAAGLAALLFAVDDAHGMPAGFISNRNALLATLFGVLSLIAHDRWRRERWPAGMVLAPLLLVLSLLSAEAGISTCAYLAAYALFIDRGTWHKRIVSLLPYALVVVIWRILWSHLGYGVANVGIYIDPVRDPIRFISALKDRAPFLLLGQLALPPAGTAILLGPEELARLWWVAVGFMAAAAAVLLPLIWRQRTARFWAVGMALSVLPICATFPDDRLLLFVGIGAMGLVAQFLGAAFGRCEWRPRLILWRIGAWILAVVFILRHVVVAPVALVARAACPVGPKNIMPRLMINEPLKESVANQDLVVVNPPVAFFVHTSALTWASEEWPVPRRLRVLTSSLFEPVSIHRPDERTLVVRPAYGYYPWVLDKLFRTEKHSFRVGDRLELMGMTVEITELTGDGRPAEAAFTFSVALEDDSLRWLQYKDGRFVPFSPPAVGEAVVIGGDDLFEE